MGPRRKVAITKLQQSLDDLGAPLMLNGRSYHTTYEFRTLGLMVINNFVDKSYIQAAKVSSMKNRFH